MKKHHLFFCTLIFITCGVFTWKAESHIGQELGYIAVVISMVFFSKNIISKLDT